MQSHMTPFRSCKAVVLFQSGDKGEARNAVLEVSGLSSDAHRCVKRANPRCTDQVSKQDQRLVKLRLKRKNPPSLLHVAVHIVNSMHRAINSVLKLKNLERTIYTKKAR